MNMTDKNFRRTLLLLVALSIFALAAVIAIVKPGMTESAVVAGTNTAPSEAGFGNTGIYARFVSDTQGEIVGSNSRETQGGEDVADYTELVWASFSALAPYDGGVRSGSTVYEPFTIVKSIDKATPLLLRALAASESMTVEIFIFGSDPQGGSDRLELKYTLTNASITSQRTSSSTNTSNSAGEFSNTETVGISFHNMTIEHIPGSTSHEVSWGSGI